ncbi:hypothetical protein MYOV065v1_p0037 [Vibrio phage PS15B.2]|nr:hypothetical protein MYOV065v1_p0037 [Vibrio phage PS15B.2]
MKIQVRHTISSLSKERDSAVTKATIAVEAISDLMFTVNSATGRNIHSEVGCFVGVQNDSSKMHKIKMITREVDVLFWQKLIKLCQFKEIMHSKKFDQLETELYKNTPPFTVDNATATLTQLINELPDLLTELVRNTFTCRSKDHKSNGKVKLDKKQVYKSLLSSSYGENILIDITRAISILEGVDNEHILQELKQNREITKYDGKVKFKAFLNHNVHVTFLDEELLNKMNDVLNKCYSGQIGSA